MSHFEESTEARAAFSDARFRALVQKSCDIITVIGPDITVLYVSPSVESIMGYHPSDLVGKAGLDFIHPEDTNLAAQRLGEILGQPGSSALLELRARHANGAWRWLEVNLHNLLHDPDVEGIVINQRDITDRKALELQARQFQKMEAIGKLSGGIAHDFGNLLSVIRGCGQLLQEFPDERRSELLDAIMEATQKGAQLTRRLLAFSRQSPFHLEELHLGRVVSGMESLLQLRLGPGIGLDTVVEPGLWSIRIDRSECEQMLLNLAVNASEALRDGGSVRIVIANQVIDEDGRSEGDPAPGAYVRLVFSDTGPGIEPDLLPNLFEPFFTTKKDSGGTGLGLANVHSTVLKAGGHIEVESEPGVGTSFTIELPAITPSEGG
ncbi:MAG: two-component system sensor histidine kinase NtrB [Actinomycetota bacterium]